MEFHALSEIFPLMAPSDLEELAEDIKQNGLREAIVTYQEKILDGRNRYLACKKAGVEPIFEAYEDKPAYVHTKDPLNYVISLNLKRRHLGIEQKAKVGSDLANMRHGGDRSKLPDDSLVSVKDAAELLGVSESAVHRYRYIQKNGIPELLEAIDNQILSIYAAHEIASLPRENQLTALESKNKDILEISKKIRDRRTKKRREKRYENLVEISKNNQPLTGEKKYAVILADPPWQHDFAPSESRSIENQYPTMSFDELLCLPVEGIAQIDAVLFMWATPPLTEKAIKLIDAWGFEYKGHAVWDKEIIGLGFYFRYQHELLLVGMKKNFPTPHPENRVSSIIRSKRESHSKKPEVVYDIIEKMYPDLPRIELFSRNKRNGWDAWGNQSS